MTRSFGPLASRIREQPVRVGHGLAGEILEEVRRAAAERAPDDRVVGAGVEIMHAAAGGELLLGIIEGSPYLATLLRRDPARAARFLAVPPEVELEAAGTRLVEQLGAATTQADAMAVLRRYKDDAALLIALADIAGVWGVLDVTRALTEVAERAISGAVRFLFRTAQLRGDWRGEGGGDPAEDSGFIVLGMGKFGAHELNYSSDVDLIVFYEAERARLREGLETPAFFVRVTRDLVRLLQERTADGYVFRTDLRLRPDPGATQAAISTSAALVYYESFGQNWERAAMIKARPVAGDLAAGHAFLAELAPYVWRKYLDYAAIADIHAMKRQIHAYRGFGDIGVAGHNIKL